MPLWLNICIAIGCLVFDLTAIKSEPNLERRSERALDNASTVFDTARDAYTSGDVAKSKSALEEVRESVNVAYESLEKTGKDGRHNPKLYKRAELKTRELLRRLQGMAQAVSLDDRAFVEEVRTRVSEIHDDLIKDIMKKK